MRIGIDARMVFYTGIGRHVLNLLLRLPAFSRQDDFVYFIRPEDEVRLSGLLSGDKEVSNTVRLVPTISGIYNLAEQTEHLRILEKERLDLLHVPHFNVPIRYRGGLVVTVHDLIQAHFPSQDNLMAQIKKIGYKYVISQAMQKASKIIAVSDYTKQDIITTFGVESGKIQVIHNGVDEKWSSSKVTPDKKKQVLKRLDLETPFFLYVGLSSPHKNLLRLVEAMAIVRQELEKQDLSYQLALVGKKDERYLPAIMELIQKKDMQDCVKILDHVSDEDLLVLYKSASAFVFPSLYEGFGLPPLEALQAGLPVLSSSATCLPEVLGEGVIYFDPLDMAEIARKMTAFALGELSPAKEPVPQYSWDEMTRDTLQVYQDILSENG